MTEEDIIQFKKISLVNGSSNPSMLKLHEMTGDTALLFGDDDPGVVVEDENGEIRHITYAWYDKERQMLRLTIGETKFEDFKE